MTQTKLKELKIDVVDELHEIRRKHSRASSEEIEQGADEVLKKIKKEKAACLRA